jgi:anti-sigma B factor antagonist
VTPFSLQEELLPGDDVLVLAVHGELDLFTVPELRERLRAHVEEGSGDVVVDLCACELVDAGGCRALLTASRRLAAHGRRLAIVNTVAAHARVFAVMGLGELFPIVRTPAQAAIALRARAA